VIRAIAGVLAMATLLFGIIAIDIAIVSYKGAANAEVAAKRMAVQRDSEANYASAGVLLAACVTTVQHYLVQPGLQPLEHAAQWIPAGVIALEDQVIVAHAASRQGFPLATAGAAVGAVLLNWGIQMGAPSFYWALPIISGLPIDQQFAQEGPIYRIASVAPGMLLMGAILYAAFSEATHSKLAR
jgi:hypothetical protein